MILFALALFLGPAADDHTLGIGIDVIPEVFSQAARRAAIAADLRLATCTDASCVWTLGDGVAVRAHLAPGTLSIDRIEADVDEQTRHAVPATAARYRGACLTIVTLMYPDWSAARRTATAASIARTNESDAIEQVEPDLTFFGRGGPDRAATCGAMSLAD